MSIVLFYVISALRMTQVFLHGNVSTKHPGLNFRQSHTLCQHVFVLAGLGEGTAALSRFGLRHALLSH